MANQLVILRPNTGTELDIDGGTTYHLGLDTDWGESSVDASLLEGPDITGAVAGQRRLLTRSRSLVIQVRATTGAAYLAAAEAFVACVSNIQRYGGVIVRQVDLGGAGFSEALECEILEASLSEAEDGWLEATRLHGEVVLNLTTQPQWFADWTQAEAVLYSTDSLIECEVDALRGNLPGPGRIVLEDKTALYEEMIIDDGPALYWPLNATYGATDQSGNGRDGITSGGITVGGDAGIPTGLTGQTSTNFDGSNDFIYSSSYNPYVNGTTRTFTGWAYSDTFAAQRTLFGSNAGHPNATLFVIDPGPIFTFYMGAAAWTGGTGSNAAPAAGGWFHWALIVNESTDTMQLYVNGALAYSPAAYTPTHVGSQTFSLGAWATGSSAQALWDGKMAHVAVFERALTAAEIEEHYDIGAAVLLGTARRFVELGGSFENYVSGQQTEFRAGSSGGDFSLTGADGFASTFAITDRIGTHSIAIDPVLPAWTTIGFLENLDQIGTHRVRARVLSADADVTITVRALWRSGSGAWHELDSAPVPAADSWWDLPLGTISHYDSAETIDVRFDVYSTEVSSAAFFLNIATVTAADLYTVARGQTSAGVVGGASGYDSMAADDTDMATRTAQLGGAWTAFGSNDQFVHDGGISQTRSYDDASLTAGRGYVLAALSATDIQTVSVDGQVHGTTKDTTTIIGAITRYVDASNWGLAAMKSRRTAWGHYYPQLVLYKCIAGTLTVIKQVSLPTNSAVGGKVTVSIDASGNCEVAFESGLGKHAGTVTSFTAYDSVFDAGTLATGKMGFYGATTATNGYLAVHEFIGYAEVTEYVTADVIRADGTGELTYSQAFSAEADGSDPQPVSSVEGRRIWLPPGLDGLITAKVRESDSDAEVDTGHSNSTGLTVYHRPAFSTLSDALE